MSTLLFGAPCTMQRPRDGATNAASLPKMHDPAWPGLAVRRRLLVGICTLCSCVARILL